MAKKTSILTPQITASTSWKETDVDGRLQELKALERDNLAAILALESEGGGGALASPGGQEIHRRALVLMNGSAPRQSAALPSLSDLRLERAAIAEAIHVLAGEQTLARTRAQNAALEELGMGWRELLREIAVTLCRLRKLNRLRGEYRSLVPAKWPCDRQRLFGDGSPSADEADAFFSDLIRAGIVTPGELSKWMETE